MSITRRFGTECYHEVFCFAGRRVFQGTGRLRGSDCRWEQKATEVNRGHVLPCKYGETSIGIWPTIYSRIWERWMHIVIDCGTFLAQKWIFYEFFEDALAKIAEDLELLILEQWNNVEVVVTWHFFCFSIRIAVLPNERSASNMVLKLMFPPILPFPLKSLRLWEIRYISDMHRNDLTEVSEGDYHVTLKNEITLFKRRLTPDQ